MKTVLLLGDSVRQNYDHYVQERLQGRAKVFYPRDNGMFTQLTLRYLHDWYRAVLKGEKPDVVHFNCGLWDVLRLSNEHNTFNSLTAYVDMLGRIVARIWFLSPEARLIFATTTPVIEPGFTPGVEFGSRSNDDIVRFNQEAVKFFHGSSFSGAHTVAIDDLWSVIRQTAGNLHSDNVHYDTERGRVCLGEAVIKALL